MHVAWAQCKTLRSYEASRLGLISCCQMLEVVAPHYAIPPYTLLSPLYPFTPSPSPPPCPDCSQSASLYPAIHITQLPLLPRTSRGESIRQSPFWPFFLQWFFQLCVIAKSQPRPNLNVKLCIEVWCGRRETERDEGWLPIKTPPRLDTPSHRLN